MDRNVEDLARELHSSRYKLTPQRQIILEIIAENRSRHLSAEDIYEVLKRDPQK